MEIRIHPAGEAEFKVSVEHAGVTLLRGRKVDRRTCLEIVALLREPGWPGIKFVREGSWSVALGQRRHRFSCHYLTEEEQVEVGWSGYLDDDEEVKAVIRQLQGHPVAMLVADELPAAKKVAKKATKQAAKKARRASPGREG